MDRVKAMMLIGAAILCFIAGFFVASKIYQSKISDIEAAHAMALAKAESEYRANQSKQIKAINDAWTEYEKAQYELQKSRADYGSLRNQLERVRLESDRYRAELSRAGANPCKHFVERLDRCVGLLDEGAELVTEGAGLSQRSSAKHDAAVRIHNGQKLN